VNSAGFTLFSAIVRAGFSLLWLRMAGTFSSFIPFVTLRGFMPDGALYQGTTFTCCGKTRFSEGYGL
jgi:hypothetical protein